MGTAKVLLPTSFETVIPAAAIDFDLLLHNIESLIREHPMNFPNRPPVDMGDPNMQWEG